MATKPNYVNAGYQNALQFDAGSGIIKYGNYEFFADQVTTPNTTKVTFDNYRMSKEPQRFSMPGMAMYPQKPTQLSPDVEARMRADFAADVQSGKFAGYTPSPGRDSSPTGSMTYFNGQIPAARQASFDTTNTYRKINQVDDNTFEVNSYSVPGDIDFLNKLSERAQNLNANAALGQTTDANRSAGATGRLGKPNYSRAATILAGESAPLGGAKTTLGA